MAKTKILICSSEVGAGKRGASLGPDALRISAVNLYYNIFDRLPTEEIKTVQINKYSPEHKSAKYIKQILSTHRKIANKTADALREGYRLFVLSGDHSNAAGFFSGFREAYPDAKLGLIWIDAHGDIHSPYTSPSGNMHGMPIALLLAQDNIENQAKKLKPEVIKNWEKLKRSGKNKISPKLLAEDLFYIGIRDLEQQEWDLIHKLKINYFTSKDVREQGAAKIAQKVSQYFKNYDALYISFDVDSLDPSISVGTGTPVPEGLNIEEAEVLLNAFSHLPNCKVLEVTEINPLLDTENRMATAVTKILRDSNSIR